MHSVFSMLPLNFLLLSLCVYQARRVADSMKASY
jgi:hypothetical protein